jgi:predicted O-linked N-acetylglucosamine transferase (SPINDLY family)
VLIFPEVAADQPTVQLAALRLAPVQCASWGQPVTTGLPTMDFYLSGAAMERTDADADYCERLIRLPGLGAVYHPHYAAWGDALPGGDVWAGYGLEDNAIRFLCCQSTQKYLPAHDALYARIAKALPMARFVFVTVLTRPAEILAARLNAAFAQQGLEAGRYCRFVPSLSQAGFSALIRDAHVFLDTPDWSGCNTTLDAVMHGVPVVTIAGASMRSRHGVAILGIAEVSETIAASEDDYVSIALRLGCDLAFRSAIADALRAGRHRLIGDLAPVRALEAFLVRAVAEATANRT